MSDALSMVLESVAPNGGLRRRGLMLVLSSPSGAGKTTISRRILEADKDIIMSVSVTTRAKRPAEEDGRDYFFIDNDRYKEMVAAADLLEYAWVFDHYYGTPRQFVLRHLQAGRDVLFDIDWQGTQQLRQRAREDLVSVFILPPSYAELERRLHARGQDSEDVMRHRMARAADEMSHWPEYSYIIVNENIDTSVEKVRSILLAERLKRERQVGLMEFVRKLQGQS